MGGFLVLACWHLVDAASRRWSPRFSRQASGCHWAAAGSWGLPVCPGAGGLRDGAVPVRLAGAPVLPGTWGGLGLRGGTKREGGVVGCGGSFTRGEPALPFVCTSWALGALGGGGWAGGSPGSSIPQALPVGWLPWCPPAPLVSSLGRGRPGPRPLGWKRGGSWGRGGEGRQGRGTGRSQAGRLGAALKSEPPGWVPGVASQAE